jgi:putative cell wall-binding protein
MGAVLLAGLVGSLLAFASPSAALLTEEADTARIDGDDRYETAAAIATNPHWWGDSGSGVCSPDVTIVNGEDWPDGLTAGIYGDRVLLVRPDKIPAATEAAIIELMNQSQNPNIGNCGGQIDLTVIGGPAAVSSAVYEQLTLLTNGTGGYVDDEGRIFGGDRYETAIAVHDDESSSGCAILATGTDFPDALAAGVLAHDDGCGILLNKGAALLPAVKAYMIEVGMEYVRIAGGEAAVPASVEAELLSMGINVTRYGGENRDETATLLADDSWNGDRRSACLVNRDSFADALAAAPFCASSAVDGQIMLVRADSIPPVTAAWHVANCANLGDYTWADINLDADDGTTPEVQIYGKVFAIGGTTVISDEVLEDAAAATKCSDEIAVTSATISYENAQDQVCLVQNLGLLEWTGPEDHDGPVLIPVTGSAADGLFPTITFVEIDGEGTATDVFPAEAYFSGDTLYVDLGEDTDGMTQARFVEIWSSLPEAAATFTAVANSGPLFGPPLSGDAGVWVYCTSPSADVVFEMVFNQPVGSGADFKTTPYGHTLVDEGEWWCLDDFSDCGVFDFMLFTILDDSPLSESVGDAILAGDFTASWLWDVPDADGNTTFTMTVADIAGAVEFTDWAGECLFEPCFEELLAPGAVSTAYGVENEFLAGSLYPSDGSTLTWTGITGGLG